ncbi:MAG: hypothetical protein J2P27_07465 [Actinobacteria bacterium]|nr:hypothetical protein [Actinomycetota bacterium]
MTYQPYPTGGGGNAVQQTPRRPQSVRIAVLLMYVGAALSAVSLILLLAASGSIRSAIDKAARNARTTPPLTTAQIHSIENGYIVGISVLLIIFAGLWAWMAWANGRGKGWARIVSSVFFGFMTLFLLLTITRAGGQSILVVIEWVVGLAALILLWRSETTQFIAQSQTPYGR